MSQYLKGDFPAGSRRETRSREQRGCLSQYGSLEALLCLQLEAKWHPGRHSRRVIDLVVRAARGRLQLLSSTHGYESFTKALSLQRGGGECVFDARIFTPTGKRGTVEVC